VLSPDRIYRSGFREPVLEALFWELSNPRSFATWSVERLVEVFIVHGLRSEITAGFWSAPRWLAALTHPLLPTCLADARSAALPRSVKDLAAEAHRSPGRIRERLKAHSGESAGRLLGRSRIERALHHLERGTPSLHDLARRVGYVNVSSFCRAFRRE